MMVRISAKINSRLALMALRVLIFCGVHSDISPQHKHSLYQGCICKPNEISTVTDTPTEHTSGTLVVEPGNRNMFEMVNLKRSVAFEYYDLKDPATLTDAPLWREPCGKRWTFDDSLVYKSKTNKSWRLNKQLFAQMFKTALPVGQPYDMFETPSQEAKPAVKGQSRIRKRSVITFKQSDTTNGVGKASYLSPSDEQPGAIVFNHLGFKIHGLHSIKRTTFATRYSHRKIAYSKKIFPFVHDSSVTDGSMVHNRSPAGPILPREAASDADRADPAKTTTASAAEQVVNNTSIDTLLEEIHDGDIRIKWAVHMAFKVANQTRDKILEVVQLVQSQAIGRNTRIDQTLRSDVLEKRAQWMPTFNSLLRNYTDPSEPKWIAKVLLDFNLYLQYFGVTLEQMIYEQVILDKHHELTDQLRQLNVQTMKLICDTYKMAQLLIQSEVQRQELLSVAISLRKSNRGGNMRQLLADLHKETVNSLQNRLDYRGTWLDTESIRRDWFQDSHLRRTVMPIQERQITSHLKRGLRDESIMGDYEQALAFYEKLLNHIYA